MRIFDLQSKLMHLLRRSFLVLGWLLILSVCQGAVSIVDDGLLLSLCEELAEYEPYWEFRHGVPARAAGAGPHKVLTTSVEQFGWRMELIREDGCICELEDDTGITEASFDGALRFWPNPSREHVYIDLRDLPALADGASRTLQILDQRGSVLREQRVAYNVEVLHVADMPPGAYILRVLPEGRYGLMVKM